MKSKVLSGLLILMAVVFLSKAEVFNVTNVDELRTALSTAESNGEDDVINILSGNYDVDNVLNYNPNGNENYSLILHGEDPTTTILDGTNNISRILNINLHNLLDDSSVIVKIENITFQNSDNYETNGTVLRITGNSASVVLSNNIFQNNIGAHGYIRGANGVLYVSITSGNVLLTGNTFLNNTAKSGVLYIENGTGNVEVSKNTFEENTATLVGGALFLAKTDGKAFIKDNKFFKNSAETQLGGAICLISGTSQIFTFNNFFMQNSAGIAGGAVYSIINDGAFWLFNNTIYNNQAESYGSGVYVSLYSKTAVLNAYNNIIRDNISNSENPKGEDLYVDNDYMGGEEVLASPVNLFNNDLGDNSDVNMPDSEDLFVKETSSYQHGNNIFEDPMFIDPDNGDLHLQTQSMCINTGSNDIFDKLLELEIEVPEDIDGDPRIYDDVVDIGADESLVPKIEVSPEMLDFGTFNVGDEPVSKTFTISNTGYGVLKFKSIWLWGLERKAYKIIENKCIETKLKNGETCDITIQINPESVGMKKAFVVVVSNDPNKPKLIYKLNAVVRGEFEPKIEVEPTLIEFSSEIPETIVVTNNGNGDLIIHKLKIYGINADEFEIVDENCTQDKIEPGKSCEVSVKLKSKSLGDKKGVLIIYSNDPENFSTKVMLKAL